MNSIDRGMPLGATQKQAVLIAQAENRADMRAMECGMLAMSQVLLSKQKRVESLTKMLELPGISENVRQGLLGQIMALLDEIANKENCKFPTGLYSL